MANLVLVVVCLLAGALFRKTGRMPEATPVVATRIVIDLALPALTIVTIHGLPWVPGQGRELLLLLATPLVLFAVAFVAVAAAGRAFGWSREVKACLLLTAGLANTSFVGFPLTEALFGREGLARAVLVDQGQFLVLATLGMLTAGAGRGRERPSVGELGRRLLVFPPFVAFVLALALRPVALPPFALASLDKLGALVVPLALFAVGWQLRLAPKDLAADRGPLAVGLTVRLLVAPAVVLAIVQRGFGSTGLAGDVAVAEAAMAPMITGALLAMESGLAPRLATAMVGLGVPLSLLSVPAWAWFLRG